MCGETDDPKAVDLEVQLRDGRTVRFRNVRDADTDLFLGFFDGLSAQSRAFMHGWSSRCDRGHAESIAALAGSDDYLGVAAVVPASPGERIVGYSWINGLTGQDIPMLGIGVADEYHNVGLGRALLTLMIEQAGKLGVPRVRLGVFDHNPRAMHVYELAGFRVDPSKPARMFDEGREVYMVVETGGSPG